MSAFDNFVSASILALGALALITGILTFSVAAIVFGGSLALGALWFRRSLARLASIEANTREITRALALLARLQQGRMHEGVAGPEPDVRP